jgi:hypothetical protein
VSSWKSQGTWVPLPANGNESKKRANQKNPFKSIFYSNLRPHRLKVVKQPDAFLMRSCESKRAFQPNQTALFDIWFNELGLLVLNKCISETDAQVFLYAVKVP